MSIYAISDLHLSFSSNKPMDRFGEKWVNYEEKLKQNWINTIKEDDVVILPGDFSWAMYLKETYKDFEYLNSLPGKKILIKGNHDYWWSTLAKMNQYLEENKFDTIQILHNNSFKFEDWVICGTRFWQDIKEDDKIYNRELKRLELSIDDAKNKYGEESDIIVATHYPPNFDDEQFMNFLKNNNVKKYIYGHLHNVTLSELRDVTINNIEFKLVSCDYLEFNPIKLI